MFLATRKLKSITASKDAWMVRFEMMSRPNEFVIGGAVTFYVDRLSGLVIKTQAEQ
jgi:hypothetical protein